MHKRFRSSVLGDLLFAGLFLLFILGALVFSAYLLRKNHQIGWIGIVIGANVLIDSFGFWVLVGTLPYHALLNRLVEEKISAEAMTITIRTEEIFDEGIGTKIEKVDLRFLGENSDLPPAITLEYYISQSSTKNIAPGARVKVFGARESKGPVVVETENGFLWPTYHGRTTRGGHTTRRETSNNSLSQET